MEIVWISSHERQRIRKSVQCNGNSCPADERNPEKMVSLAKSHETAPILTIKRVSPERKDPDANMQRDLKIGTLRAE